MMTPATNLEKAWAAWGEPPEWVKLLAEHCDQHSQNAVAERLQISATYVSRIINRTYTASYAEAQETVESILGRKAVDCPVFGEIPLTSCIRNRRRTGPATNTMQRTFERHCPRCPLNSDRKEVD